ncbi:hypothetical protein [Undibacterium sp. TC9W]|uniref:hypothetical protein n=1 Tax=Undibacterium sp. TC9W TaxID=3413053 RepID=UPI003BF5E94D
MKPSAVSAVTGFIVWLFNDALAMLDAAALSDTDESGLLSACCLPQAEIAAQINTVQPSLAILDTQKSSILFNWSGNKGSDSKCNTAKTAQKCVARVVANVR